MTSLALASRFFLDTVQPVLYQDVVLGVGNSSIYTIDTLRLISDSPTLTNCLRVFRILHPDTFDDEIVSECIQLTVDIFLKATSLRSFNVHGRLFKTEYQQEAFVRSAQEREIPLMELTCYDTGFPSDEFAISRMCYISWDGTFRSSF